MIAMVRFTDTSRKRVRGSFSVYLSRAGFGPGGLRAHWQPESRCKKTLCRRRPAINKRYNIPHLMSSLAENMWSLQEEVNKAVPDERPDSGAWGETKHWWLMPNFFLKRTATKRKVPIYFDANTFHLLLTSFKWDLLEYTVMTWKLGWAG